MVKTNIQTFSGEVEILSNLHVGNYLTANGTASNVLDITGNVGATFFVGDGGFLSNIATTLNDIVANPGGNTVSNTLVFESGADVTSNTAIVTYANVGISISNTEPTGEFQLSIGSNIFVNTHAANVLTVVGAIGSDLFIGDGGLLSNIATTIDQIIDQGNTVSNTLQLISGMDATSNTGLVTHKDVGISISNTAPTGEFQFGVGSNLFVNTYSSNVLSIEGNVNAQKMTLGTISVTSAYGLNHVTAQGSATGDTISLSNVTTGLEVTSNITAGGNVTAETVITSANVEVGNRLKFASNVFVDDLRIADLAANLVTYDKTTGELMDSGGLFANKLAVVSVQPPSVLTANATTIAKHGTYTVTTSSLAENSNAWNAFDGDSAVEWTSSPTVGRLYDAADTDGVYGGTSNLFTGNYIQPGVSSAGEWLAIEFPYKTTLRHMKLTPPATLQRYPASANVYATNDSLTWTEVAQWGDVDPVTSSNVQTVVVNATESFKKYAMVVTKANGGADNVALAKWDLFAESFSIDGGQISMAQQPVTGGETVMDQSGPHGRGAAKLKKYPEIVFESGKFDSNESTNTYVQAGYTVTASGVTIHDNILMAPWKLLDGISDNLSHRWRGETVYVNNSSTATPSALDPSSPQTQLDTNTSIGEYLIIKTPSKIQLKNIIVNSPNMHMPYEVDIYGRNEGVSTWTHVKNYTYTIPTGTDNSAWNTTNQIIYATEYYSEYAFVIVKTNGRTAPSIGELELYGYEEDIPLGDTSVDTTFTSIMNTPQTTGAQVYVDGSLGETFTNRVVGPTVSNTHTTYVSAEKYWELSGNVESNVTLEANTFLSGDAPHSISMWFNSSNLEANVSNSCIFSLATEEKLDSVNLDLQSNTWHNLTYAYQGEGGSRVTYLDGRKVAEDQAEDTFGEYPPFAMTGYSQGGYVASASSENNGITQGFAYLAFDGIADGTRGYHSTGTYSPGVYQGSAKLTGPGPIDYDGEWIKLELPHKIKVTGVSFAPRISVNPGDNYSARIPYKGYILGSNTGSDGSWELVHSFDNVTTTEGVTKRIDFTGTNEYYKHIAMVAEEVAPDATFGTVLNFSEMEYYGHRENDLVRLPDPTNVLKYPHIAMTGPAQRGYVASESSTQKPNGIPRPAHQAFNGGVGGAGVVTDGWASLDSSYNNQTGEIATPQGPHPEVSESGEWIQIQLPHKLLLDNFTLSVGTHDVSIDRNQARYPKEFKLYGYDGSSWAQIGSDYSTAKQTSAGQVTTYDVTTTTYYSKFLIIIKKTWSITGQFTNLSTLTQIGEWELYGTEEATPIPLQIGGGNIDKVANFRVYDKFVGEDQALEIWDAQKDEFGRAKSSMTLQKGRLGIGTTEPQGRLAVLDEPDPTTYGFQEFPPKPLAGYKTYFEGHGEFCVSASSEHTTNFAWEAFDKSNDEGRHYQHATGSGGGYSTSDGSYGGSVRLSSSGTPLGVYLVLKMPYKIHLKQFSIQPRNNAGYLSEQTPKDGQVWGSNDGDSWYHVHSYTGLTFTSGTDTVYFNVNHTNAYSRYALIVTKSGGGTNSFEGFSIGELRYFGYREQLPPKQSVLHDGQLTLTKSLTVPRIGPALDADDTPRRDRLVVEYNTSTNPTFEGAVRDTSGRGLDGGLVGGAYYDANAKAFEFDGTDDYIFTGNIGNHAGAWVHSYSVWINLDDYTNENIVLIGRDASTNKASSLKVNNSTQIQWFFFGSDVTFPHSMTLGSWYHIACVYDGGAPDSSRRMWINGTELTISVPGVGTALNLDANAEMRIGRRQYNTATNNFNGSISNFKLYDTALTAEEVKTLYDMGRCDEGHHVVNFSKTRVGIGLGDGEAPTYTLDVRGQIRSQGSLVTSFTGQHKCIPDEPMEKGLIVSAKKNQFVKLNGLAIGKSAITIDESLPIVSLSNVVQDKACFGVVSATEEANTTFRVETTNGGVISTIPKTLGDNRAIVNSVGEGAIWVVDTNGPLESGDYITTSNVVGYGQKQDDDILHNYTVAKITMDCDFTGSNVAVQTIKREETGLQTIMEDTWNQLADYDRSSNTETQYSNTLAPSAYSGQSGYVPREVTTIVDYTDGSNIVSIAEWSNLESNIQNTYQSNTFTEIVDYTKFVSVSEWSNLTTDVQNTYSEAEITTYYQIQRGGNVLDENGQLQFEDKTGATEAPYERRFLDASGAQTDSANAVHIAAFVGCTYHCG
jgi:hypothetical protein